MNFFKIIYTVISSDLSYQEMTNLLAVFAARNVSKICWQFKPQRSCRLITFYLLAVSAAKEVSND
jgi:hypothetical protein